MTDEKADPNTVIYQGELVDGQVVLTSVQYSSEFVNAEGQVVMTCEEIPFATSPFCEEPSPPSDGSGSYGDTHEGSWYRGSDQVGITFWGNT